MAPSRSMLKNAFFSSSGSKVHSISWMPRASASSRCAASACGRRPRLRYSGSTPSMWLCRYDPPPGFNPGMDSRSPPCVPPSYAPNAWPPTFVATTNSRTGSSSTSANPQIVFCRLDRFLELPGFRQRCAARSSLGFLPERVHFGQRGFFRRFCPVRPACARCSRSAGEIWRWSCAAPARDRP